MTNRIFKVAVPGKKKKVRVAVTAMEVLQNSEEDLKMLLECRARSADPMRLRDRHDQR